MTDEFRVLCAELVELCTPVDSIPQLAERLQKLNALADRARTLLAEPPAEGPSDQELDDFVARVWPHSPGKMPDDEWRHDMAETIRAAVDEIGLARWGRPAAEPVPEPGEVGELVAWLRENAADERDIEHGGTIEAAQRLDRAATLLQQLSAPAPVVAPVPLSERMPGPEDCDGEGRCWLGGRQMGRGTPTWLLGYPAWAERFPDVHRFWLPANALPTPDATND